MTINSNGVCGRDFQGELDEGSECPEIDDCPSHIEEKGLAWWGDNGDKSQSVNM